MQSFNMLFTHKKTSYLQQRLCAEGGGNEWAPVAPLRSVISQFNNLDC